MSVVAGGGGDGGDCVVVDDVGEDSDGGDCAADDVGEDGILTLSSSRALRRVLKTPARRQREMVRRITADGRISVVGLIPRIRLFFVLWGDGEPPVASRSSGELVFMPVAWGCCSLLYGLCGPSSMRGW